MKREEHSRESNVIVTRPKTARYDVYTLRLIVGVTSPSASMSSRKSGGVV